MSRFAKQLARGIAKVAKATSESVTYRRGEIAVELFGTRGEKAADQQQTTSETTVTGIRVDWIFTAAEINRTAGEIVPMKGDTITDLQGVVYRVTSNPIDNRESRWMRHRVALRIHTLIVKGE